MVGPGKMGDTLTSLEQQSDADWVAAALPADRMPTAFQPHLLRDFLEGDGAACAYVLFGLAGTILTQHALRRIGHAFSVFDDAQAVYGDLDIRSDDGSVWPLALSAFDYERMLEQGYCAHLFALRSSVAVRALATGASDLYRLFNSILEDEASRATALFTFPAVSAFCRRSIPQRQAGHLRLPASRISKPEALRPKPRRCPRTFSPRCMSSASPSCQALRSSFPRVTARLCSKPASNRSARR